MLLEVNMQIFLSYRKQARLWIGEFGRDVWAKIKIGQGRNPAYWVSALEGDGD
jgi:hypothetical protein